MSEAVIMISDGFWFHFHSRDDGHVLGELAKKLSEGGRLLEDDELGHALHRVGGQGDTAPPKGHRGHGDSQQYASLLPRRRGHSTAPGKCNFTSFWR